MECLALINPENAEFYEVKDYRQRTAVRAVLVNPEGKIALIFAKTHNYYKLPGGGVEGDESHILTLNRECEEEVGCSASLNQPIGYIEEWRKIFSERQISYAYSAKMNGEQKSQNLMADEAADGFEIIWVSAAEALKLCTETKTEHRLARDYMMPRDVKILMAYQSMNRDS